MLEGDPAGDRRREAQDLVSTGGDFGVDGAPGVVGVSGCGGEDASVAEDEDEAVVVGIVVAMEEEREREGDGEANSDARTAARSGLTAGDAIGGILAGVEGAGTRPGTGGVETKVTGIEGGVAIRRGSLGIRLIGCGGAGGGGSGVATVAIGGGVETNVGLDLSRGTNGVEKSSGGWTDGSNVIAPASDGGGGRALRLLVVLGESCPGEVVEGCAGAARLEEGCEKGEACRASRWRFGIVKAGRSPSDWSWAGLAAYGSEGK